MTPIDDDTQPSWRKPAAAFMILAIITLWAALVVTVIGWLDPLPFWLTIPVYTIAGLAWILPLKPILLWSETGRWR